MSGPTAIIAEDEANLRDELRETLAEIWPELEIKAEARDGDEACAALELHRPDIIFLDIQMPGMTGLDVAKNANGLSQDRKSTRLNSSHVEISYAVFCL